MRLEDLTPEQQIQILVTANSQQLEFPTAVEEANARRHAVIASPILKDNKIVSFRGEHILTHLLVVYPDAKPHIFYNVSILNMRKPDGALCHEISTLSNSKEFNRRGTFRCFIGSGSQVQIGVNCSATDAILKDISVTGFAFVVPKEQTYADGAIVHTLLTDYVEELNQEFIFHLYGIIVRSQILKNGNIVYGCRLNAPVVGLEKYIMTKERLRLQKSRGRS